jgi:hypothetical protein
MKPGNWPGRAPASMRAANRAGERWVAVRLRLAAGVIVRLVLTCLEHGNRLLGTIGFQHAPTCVPEMADEKVAHQLKDALAEATPQPTLPNDDSSGWRCAIPHPRQWHRGSM